MLRGIVRRREDSSQFPRIGMRCAEGWHTGRDCLRRRGRAATEQKAHYGHARTTCTYRRTYLLSLRQKHELKQAYRRSSVAHNCARNIFNCNPPALLPVVPHLFPNQLSITNKISTKNSKIKPSHP
jgi:hypothetical protein